MMRVVPLVLQLVVLWGFLHLGANWDGEEIRGEGMAEEVDLEEEISLEECMELLKIGGDWDREDLEEKYPVFDEDGGDEETEEGEEEEFLREFLEFLEEEEEPRLPSPPPSAPCGKRREETDVGHCKNWCGCLEADREKEADDQPGLADLVAWILIGILVYRGILW